MPIYDSLWFTPPAPLVRGRLRAPSTGAEVAAVPLVLDTGADVSLVPRSSVLALGLSLDPAHQYELIGFDGSVSQTPVVHLELLIFGRRFRGQFLTLEQEWGIVGRNILNQITVVLDGPNLAWNLQR